LITGTEHPDFGDQTPHNTVFLLTAMATSVPSSVSVQSLGHNSSTHSTNQLAIWAIGTLLIAVRP